MGNYQNPYGGRNDRAVCLFGNCCMEEGLLLRAEKETGNVIIFLRCSDIFAWATSDAEELPEERWLDFERSLDAARGDLGWTNPALGWFHSAWAVSLRGIAPQKPATDLYPAFVEMLDYLNVPWRDMKRLDQMPSIAPA